jgi:hypothetical protein
MQDWVQEGRLDKLTKVNALTILINLKATYCCICNEDWTMYGRGAEATAVSVIADMAAPIYGRCERHGIHCISAGRCTRRVGDMRPMQHAS